MLSCTVGNVKLVEIKEKTKRNYQRNIKYKIIPRNIKCLFLNCEEIFTNYEKKLFLLFFIFAFFTKQRSDLIKKKKKERV